MTSTLIANARLVNEGVVTDGDLLIRDGRIAGVGLPAPAGADVVDARGAWLLPGMIDDQVHFREPGFEHKGTIATESRAAIAGGITSYMEMPNCNPLTVTHEALRDKHARAADHSEANYAFYFGATNDNLEAIRTVDPALTCGIKVFMGASTGNMLVDDERTLEGIFAGTDLVIATHCEDTPTILANEAMARARYGEDIPVTEHANIRSAEACWKSSSLAVSLAKRFGSRLHVLHLTTAREMALFAPGPLDGKRITAEVCVHHLFFDDGWYPEKGALIKCNPAIKSPADRDALRRAVNEGRIDVIATDHAPHTAEEKTRAYAQAPAGLPLVQHALPVLLELVHRNVLGVETLVEKTAHAPARLFGVRERGFLRDGYHADLVLVDDRGEARDPAIYSKCGWSPFEGIDLRGRVRATWVNGRLRYRDGEFLEGPRGQALAFER
jgi:dihydroorotase